MADLGLEGAGDPQSILPEVPALPQAPAVVPLFDDPQQTEVPPQIFDDTQVQDQLLRADAPVPIGRTWIFDFDKSEFSMEGATPRKSGTDERQTLQQWIRRALTTQRFAYAAYPDDFGVDIEDILTGKLAGQIAAAHYAQTATEALLQHDRIARVDDMQVQNLPGELMMSAVLTLDSGDTLRIVQSLARA